MKLHNKIVQAFMFASLLTCGACTDLSDTVYSEITEESFSKNPSSINLLIGKVYTSIGTYIAATNPNFSPFYYNVCTTDEMFIPFRNVTKEWNNAKFSDAYQHSWTPTTQDLDKNWEKCFGIITSANMAIDQVNSFDGMEQHLKDVTIAEIRMARAYAYYLLIDLWGDVPYTVSSSDKTSDIKKKTSAEIYNLMMKEFDDCLPLLKEAKKDKSTTYGKFNYWAALALKAKYLLNAKIFLETDRVNPKYADEKTGLDECIDICDELMSPEAGFELEKDYFTNFKAHNENSKENIFVIPFDAVYSKDNFTLGFGYARHCLHASQTPVYNGTVNGQNGFSVYPSLYKTFEDFDVRKNGLNAGPQFDASGKPLKCIKAQMKNPDGTFMDLDFKVDFDINNCDEMSGARFQKYEYENGIITDAMNNDFVVVRLADIMMMKAECLMRLADGQATQEAVDLVNEVRNRSISDPSQYDFYDTSNLTMDALLEERRREFYGEALRRTDLIRFEKFTDMDWVDDIHMDRSKIRTEKYRTVFPLPANYLKTAPQIEQQPYYQ